MKKNPSITSPRHEAKPRSAAAMALSVVLFPIWFPVWAYCVLLAAQFDRTRDFGKWLQGRYECYRYGGFTLIELSIVLVIIGLLVGGVLAGQHLIGAAAVRAEITQIEKFNSAANTFFGKYGALPGDISPQLVTQFGFVADAVRAGTPGLGDGNGELDGIHGGSLPYAWNLSGENVYFWEDLSTNSHLIEGAFNSSIGSADNNCASAIACSAYFPAAKIGGGNSVYVYSGNVVNGQATTVGIGPNFFGLSIVNALSSSNVSYGGNGGPGLTVAQASAMDTKIDDGMPTTGRVLAQYLGLSNGGAPAWAGNSPGTATSPSSATCYDNGGNASNAMAYSITQNNGNGVNCALSFRMQAGD